MKIFEYQEFTLLVRAATTREGFAEKYMVGVLETPLGAPDHLETVSFPEDVCPEIRLLQRGRLDEDEQRNLGIRLGHFLFPSESRKRLRDSFQELKDDKGLRILLRLSGELYDIPWEYIYLPDFIDIAEPCLLLNRQISLVRFQAIEKRKLKIQEKSSRRIIVAMAAPESDAYPPLAYLSKEREALASIFSRIGGLVVAWLPERIGKTGRSVQGLTVKDIEKQLGERADIFHFSGHGEWKREEGFGSRAGEGAIVLCNEDNSPLLIPAGDLSRNLQGRGILLVVLACCESGKRDYRNVWSSIAIALLKSGIPAVLAMQHKIDDESAAIFIEAFYDALVKGCLIDEAVFCGRQAVKNHDIGKRGNKKDWGTPVLYFRQDIDRPIFAEAAETSPPDPGKGNGEISRFRKPIVFSLFSLLLLTLIILLFREYDEFVSDEPPKALIPFSRKIVLVAFEAEQVPPDIRLICASLIDKISSAGAKVIAFDLLFEKEKESDRELIDAFIRAKERNCSIVTGFNKTDDFHTHMIAPSIIENVSGYGLICIGLRPDYRIEAAWTIRKSYHRPQANLFEPTFFKEILDHYYENIDFEKGKKTVKSIQGECPFLEPGDEVSSILIKPTNLDILREDRVLFSEVEIRAQEDLEKLKKVFKNKIVLIGFRNRKELIRVKMRGKWEREYGIELWAEAINTVLYDLNLQ